MSVDGLVSVVLPAHNAERTVAATLASIRAQTYRDLEIIVVDDGSTDATAAIVRREAGKDERIRLISTRNGGVARARNIGIAASRGAYVAPIDADDLWHPEKITRQVVAIEAGGPEMAFVYTFYRRIDEADRLLYSADPWDFSGHVFLRMLLLNFIGNGSSLLIRRAPLEEVGGYEPELHRQGAQGCEDYLIQLLLASRWKVGVVPEYLTGYRLTPGAMSEDQVRMERSNLLLLEQIRMRFPDIPADVMAVAEASVRARLAVVHATCQYRFARSAIEFGKALRLSPHVALLIAGLGIRGKAARLARKAFGWPPAAQGEPRTGFLDLPPDRPGPRPATHPLMRWLEAVSGRERALSGMKPVRTPDAAHPAPAPAMVRPDAAPAGREPDTPAAQVC